MNTFRVTTLCFLLATTLVLTGCFDELGGAYDGEDKIAFAFDLVAEAEQNNEPAGTVVRGDTANTVTLPTELIGPQRSDSVSVSFTVVPDSVEYSRVVPTDSIGGADTTSYFLSNGTTAQAGSHFELVGGGSPDSGSYVLPADSSTANLTVQVLDAEENGVSLPARVSIKIEGNSDEDLLPATRFSYYTLTLVDA